MKKMFFAVLLFVPVFVFCQANLAGMGFNYSALVRDTAGRVQPLKAVTLKFTLLIGQNGSPASAPWVETQDVKTDAYGFINVTIGKGNRVSGVPAFENVDFSLSDYWILVEVKNQFTNSFDPLAKQAFQAVPYAKVAGSLAGGSVIPAGIIEAFGGDSNHVPDGWLLCDGRELNNTDPKYLRLFNAIQYSWGTSNHTNLFNIPDARGLFLRGVDYQAARDGDNSTRTPIKTGANGGNNVGSYEMDLLGSHKHIAPIAMGPYGSNWGDAGRWDHLIWGGNNAPEDHAGYTSPFGGSETRPKNIYVNYIIKL